MAPFSREKGAFLFSKVHSSGRAGYFGRERPEGLARVHSNGVRGLFWPRTARRACESSFEWVRGLFWPRNGPKWLAVAHYSWRPFGLVSRPKFHREWLCGLWSCGWRVGLESGRGAKRPEVACSSRLQLAPLRPSFSAKISPRMVVRALVLRLACGTGEWARG